MPCDLFSTISNCISFHYYFPRDAAVTKYRRKEPESPLSSRSSGGRGDAPEWKQTGQRAIHIFKIFLHSST
jgi:hypothetical protein